MKKLTIDPDLWSAACLYVKQQLRIMREFGSAPNLSATQRKQLIYDCAHYPQLLRNLNKGTK